MPLTMDQLAAELVARASGMMDLAGLSVVRDSTNPDAVGAIGYAFRSLGHAPATGFYPVDSDLAGFPTADTNTLMDLAEYRILATCRNWFFYNRLQVGAGAAYFVDLDRRLEALWDQLKAMGLLGLTPLTVGTIALDLVETDRLGVQLIDING